MINPSGKRVVLPRSLIKAPANAADTGEFAPQQIISVSVIVRRKKPLDLKALGGRHLSHEEFLENYAADPADFEALRQFAHQHNLSVDENASSLARRTMVMRGTAQAMSEAFGVKLRCFERDGKTFHGFTGEISVPEEHAVRIEAVLGLDARPIAKPHIRRRGQIAPHAAGTTSFNPPQVAALYDFPTSVNGSGQTIGIIELGGGYNSSDISKYFSGLGITAPTVVSVSVDGGTNTPSNPDGADGEVALDIQVAGSIAPGAKIAVYFTTNTDAGFLDAITTAVHDTANNPSVISISWGGPESSWSQSSLTAIDNACQSAGALGVTITVAAGDSGSSDGGSGNNVDFPASSPHVLACGGTKLEGSGSRISSETVWNDGAQGGATGGGVSVSFDLPSWQQNIGVPAASSSSGGRGVPDVAGDASPTTGYNIYVDGQSEVVGGTSAVAPLWAALIALANQQNGKAAGFVNPTLYANTKAFHDITQGSNGSFSAGPGWDACTGLGSPIGSSVISALASPVSDTGNGSSGTGGESSGGGKKKKHHDE
ncbi:S53 family peptidase [Silvibacterium acidisoli]|uniref:S53 family peptidase n=1 Tax=Acidobacteriaceae bacterium ZG23-2 TaxID=2883246 RepID=UPI00406C026E